MEKCRGGEIKERTNKTNTSTKDILPLSPERFWTVRFTHHKRPEGCALQDVPPGATASLTTRVEGFARQPCVPALVGSGENAARSTYASRAKAGFPKKIGAALQIPDGDDDDDERRRQRRRGCRRSAVNAARPLGSLRRDPAISAVYTSGRQKRARLGPVVAAAGAFAALAFATRCRPARLLGPRVAAAFVSSRHRRGGRRGAAAAASASASASASDRAGAAPATIRARSQRRGVSVADRGPTGDGGSGDDGVRRPRFHSLHSLPGSHDGVSIVS